MMSQSFLLVYSLCLYYITVEYPFLLLPMYSMSLGIQTEVENQVNMIQSMSNMPKYGIRGP